ncbi:MAG: hypothetical protein M3H12_18750 [Chromatiales bacterium]|nr:hypothetical protein [Gammaproteobacteria bacterium]
MMYWLAFFGGCLWMMIGMGVIGGLDPEGDWDEITMGGEDGNIFRFGLALISWPAVAFMMWRYDQPPGSG